MLGKNIFIANDHAGVALKETIIKHLATLGFKCTDLGTHTSESCDYPTFAHALCEQVLATGSKGILICGTGIGMSMAANKIPGVSAAVCHDSFSAVRSRCSNNAQIMCLGARVIGNELAKQLLEIWLSNDFSGGGSTDKVEMINEIEKIYRR